MKSSEIKHPIKYSYEVNSLVPSFPSFTGIYFMHIIIINGDGNELV